MIFIATKRMELAKELKRELNRMGLAVTVVNVADRGLLRAIYDPAISAVICDPSFPDYPRAVAVDILNSLGGRIPVMVIDDREDENAATAPESYHQISEQVTILKARAKEEILNTLRLIGNRNQNEAKNRCLSIPYYNVQIPISILEENGGLGILTVDASSFSKIGLEYGLDVYKRLKSVFQDMLYQMWGKNGNFRASDIICRKSVDSNIYYVFLSRSRETGSLPLPGALEMIADRLGTNIQNALWNEMFANPNGRIPDCIQSVPLVGVGFFGVLHNPCIDPSELIENGLENSRKVSRSQLVRVKERQREMMQTFIQSEGLLVPHFQAVFHLPKLSQEIVEEAQQTKSIAPLQDHLFGFESLIRIDLQATRKELGSEGDLFGIEPKFLRPDLLFSMAKSSKVALELDQACLKHASNASRDLPGTLMVNILPRNLYYIDRLKDFFPGRRRLLFEVSESEAISNFELMLKSCEYLNKFNMGIAADDFGKGFSSLERIIRIRPQVIKFDRSIIQEIDKDPIKQAYVSGIVNAAKILGTTILAEGVETWNEAVVLQKMGIDLIQGFLLHRPQTAQSILDQLAQVRLDTVA